MTAELAKAAVDVLAVWWWSEEWRHVGVSWVVKTAVVCLFVDSSPLTVNSQRTAKAAVDVLAVWWWSEEGRHVGVS